MVDEDLVLVAGGFCEYRGMTRYYKSRPGVNCFHPQVDDRPENGKYWHHNVCSRPSRIFIKRHDLPKYIAIKLIG